MTYPKPTGRLALPPQAPQLPGAVALPPVQAIGRKFYRFLRRAFAQWPPASATGLASVTQLWLALVVPWQQPAAAGPAQRADRSGGGAEWQSHLPGGLHRYA